MRFVEDNGRGQFLIHGYGPGQITVNDEVLTSSLVVSANCLIREWPPQRFEDLTAMHVEAAAVNAPEIFILGTGARLRFPHASLLADLQRRGIGVEVMDTAAACRTYNVLAGEQRRVTAALLMIV